MLRPARLSIAGPGDGYRSCALLRVGLAQMGSGDDCGSAQRVHLARGSGNASRSAWRLCDREQLWTQAYYVGTAGAVSAEVIRRHIAECQGK